MDNQVPPKPNESAKPEHDLEMIKPSKDQGIAKPKKHHGFRNFLIVLVVIIVAIVVAVAATGVYEVPFISSVFGMNKPKDLGIKTSPAALASLKQKIPMTISGPSSNYSGNASTIFTGQIPVDTQRTSEEITSWLERFQGANPPVTEVQVRFIEGGMEISGLIKDYIKAPVYVKVGVIKTSSNSIALDIQKAKLGAFSVPDNYLQQAQDWFQKKINERMANIPGYSIEKLEYRDGYSYFKGTYPQNVAPNPKGWSGLISY